MNPRAGGVALSLIFSAIGILDHLVGLCNNQLADAAPGFYFHGGRVGVVKLECNRAFKTGVYPAGILNKEAKSAN